MDTQSATLLPAQDATGPPKSPRLSTKGVKTFIQTIAHLPHRERRTSTSTDPPEAGVIEPPLSGPGSVPQLVGSQSSLQVPTGGMGLRSLSADNLPTIDTEPFPKPHRTSSIRLPKGLRRKTTADLPEAGAGEAGGDKRRQSGPSSEAEAAWWQRLEGRRHCVWAHIVDAGDLPVFPQWQHPQVSVRLMVDQQRCRTGHRPAGSAQTRPVWNETIQVDLGRAHIESTLTLKAYASTANHMAPRGYSDFAIGKAKIPYAALPVLAAPPSVDTIQRLSTTAPSQPTDDSSDLSAEGQPPAPSDQPLVLCVRLRRPERGYPVHCRPPQGRPCLRLLLCVVPVAEEVPGVVCDDEGDPEGAECGDIGPGLGTVYVDETLPSSATKLQRLIFGQGSPFVTKYCDARQYTTYSEEPWQALPDGTEQRKVMYTMPATALTKAMPCHETHTITSRAKGMYIVDKVVTTPQAPYGSQFEIRLQYAIGRVADRRCRLRVSGDVVFSKRPMLAKTIETSAHKGTQQSFAVFLDTLRPFLLPSTPTNQPPTPTLPPSTVQAHSTPLWLVGALGLSLAANVLLTAWVVLRPYYCAPDRMGHTDL